MAKASTNFEESVHYNGEAIARFYPGAHYYAVTDTHKADPNVPGDKDYIYSAQRMGGGTSLTGVMAKGQGLMLYPMYEMKKFLKLWARSNSFEEILKSPLDWDEILKAGTQAHVKKSDRGKSVGTDAHSWHEAYLKELMRVQILWAESHTTELEAGVFSDEKRKFYTDNVILPEIPEVEEVKDVLRRSYIALFKATKPANFDDYKKLPRLLFQDAEMQEAIHIEASMLHRSMVATREWVSQHDIFVYGTEDTVYSRIYQICGKYDGDISVACTSRCQWCFRNGDMSIDARDFVGRYIEDFKSTNVSTDAPKGIYPEYLAQCGVYDLAKTEEFPEIKYDGHLIVNGSKNEIVDEKGNPKLDKNKQPLRAFNTHFSFNRERNREWAKRLSGLKEDIYQAGQEMKQSA